MKILGLLFGAGVWFVVGVITACASLYYVAKHPLPIEESMMSLGSAEVQFYAKDSALITFPAVIRGQYVYCRVWVSPSRRVFTTMC